MPGFVGPLERLTKTSADFRRVIHTGPHLQLQLLTLKADESFDSGLHVDHDQFFFIAKGKGLAEIGGACIDMVAGDAAIVPAGERHTLTNTGKKRLRMFALFSPPSHSDHLIESCRPDVTADEEAMELELARKSMTNEGAPPAPVKSP